MSQRIAEARILKSQTQRFLAERDNRIPSLAKPGKFRANNTEKGVAVAGDPNGNLTIGQPLGNSIVTRKTDTSSLNNGSIDYRSATG